MIWGNKVQSFYSYTLSPCFNLYPSLAIFLLFISSSLPFSFSLLFSLALPPFSSFFLLLSPPLSSSPPTSLFFYLSLPLSRHPSTFLSLYFHLVSSHRKPSFPQILGDIKHPVLTVKSYHLGGQDSPFKEGEHNGISSLILAYAYNLQLL